MPNHDEIFGEVRSILEAPPSHEGFVSLCEQLDRCVEEVLESELVPYCLQKLAKWPAEVRVAPKEWCIAAISQEDVSEKYRVASTIDFICGSSRASWALGGSEGADKLVRFLEWHDGIERLGVKGHRLEPDGMKTLMRSPQLEKVRYLDLRYGNLGDEGAKHLAASPHLGNVKTLKLRRNKIRSKGGKALAAAKSLANLEHLGVGYNALGKTNWSAIANGSLCAKNMTFLDIGYNKVGLPVIEELLTPERSASLRFLNLRQCELDRNAFFKFAAGLDFPNLELLSLENSTDWSLDTKAMLTYAKFPRLQYIFMGWVDWERESFESCDAFIEELREHCPEFVGFIEYDQDHGPSDFWVRD